MLLNKVEGNRLSQSHFDPPPGFKIFCAREQRQTCYRDYL
jgi:hypothetical protein